MEFVECIALKTTKIINTCLHENWECLQKDCPQSMASHLQSFQSQDHAPTWSTLESTIEAWRRLHARFNKWSSNYIRETGP